MEREVVCVGEDRVEDDCAGCRFLPEYLPHQKVRNIQ